MFELFILFIWLKPSSKFLLECILKDGEVEVKKAKQVQNLPANVVKQKGIKLNHIIKYKINFMEIRTYSIDEHIHRYACWTAARAASTSRFKNIEVAKFINDSGLREALSLLEKNKKIDHEIYKKWSLMW